MDIGVILKCDTTEREREWKPWDWELNYALSFRILQLDSGPPQGIARDPNPTHTILGELTLFFVFFFLFWTCPRMDRGRGKGDSNLWPPLHKTWFITDWATSWRWELTLLLVNGWWIIVRIRIFLYFRLKFLNVIFN